MYLRKKKEEVSEKIESTEINEYTRKEMIEISENKVVLESEIITEMKTENDASSEIQILDDKQDKKMGEIDSMNTIVIGNNLEILPVINGNSEKSVDSELPISSSENEEENEEYKLV